MCAATAIPSPRHIPMPCATAYGGTSNANEKTSKRDRRAAAATQAAARLVPMSERWQQRGPTNRKERKSGTHRKERDRNGKET